MDSITSGLLLSTAMNGADNDRIADLYKMFNDGSGPSQETIQKIEGMIGRKCTVSWGYSRNSGGGKHRFVRYL